jgi:hypothetical protein
MEPAGWHLAFASSTNGSQQALPGRFRGTGDPARQPRAPDGAAHLSGTEINKAGSAPPSRPTADSRASHVPPLDGPIYESVGYHVGGGESDGSRTCLESKTGPRSKP